MASPDTAYRILLVEDNEDDRLLLRSALETLDGVGAQLDTVGGGDEAIEYLTATGRYENRRDDPWPDLILLDLGLPDRTGHSVLRWIRWEAGVTQTPVVVLTSSRSPSDIRQAYRFGANSYLLKPTGLDGLRRTAKAVVDYWFRVNVSGTAANA